jgi:hypothetical protein
MKISRILDKKLLQDFFFFLNKWFYMKYIGKHLGMERHLTHKCNVINTKLKRQKWEPFWLKMMRTHILLTLGTDHLTFKGGVGGYIFP